MTETLKGPLESTYDNLRHIITKEHSDKYKSFQNEYRKAPVRFIEECVKWKEGEGLTYYQREAVEGLITHGRVSMRGPHGLGKTALAALLVHWFGLTSDGYDWKILTTASAWRQLTRFLWPEVRKWARRLKWEEIGRAPYNNHELMMYSMRLETGEASAVASDDETLIEGAHAERLFYIFDESKSIPSKTFDAAEGAFSGADEELGTTAYALSFSTPGPPNGRFYDIQTRKPGYEDWKVISVSDEDVIKAGRMSWRWREQRAKQWGRDSAVYINRVVGDFAASDEDSVIPLAWVEAAVERWYLLQELGHYDTLRDVGVDVAYGGEDDTVIAPRYGNALDNLEVFEFLRDTQVVAGHVAAILDAHNPDARAVIDAIGYGAGTFDTLNNQGYNALAFVSSEKANARDGAGILGFRNRRSHAWWNMRELLSPSDGIDVALPPDPELIGDLTAPKWREIAGGKIQVEDKDAIKERIGRSTNKGDAAVMAFYPEMGARPRFRAKKIRRGRER